MASRSTYLRHFGNWQNALEYAGFVNGAAAQKGQEEYSTNGISSDDGKAMPDVKLINLCGRPIVFLNRHGESDILPPTGRAYIRLDGPVEPVAAKTLSAIVNDVPIIASRLRKIVVFSNDGDERAFPSPAKNTFFIVPEVVARNVYRFSRGSMDLLYPRSSRIVNEVMYIETLGVVFTNNLPICRQS